MNENGDPMDSDQGNTRTSSTLHKLYTSHFLSTWNSRLFEFGAVLFLALLTPETLLYASMYALCRSLAAIMLATKLGRYVDLSNRLVVIRASIIAQRLTVLGSCLLFGLLLWKDSWSNAVFVPSFIALAVLACMEKLGFVANTIAVERDWIPIISESLERERNVLNATMRRIDLVCKLVAPVVVAFIQSYSTLLAVTVTFSLSACSMFVEYFAIAKVYESIPELSVKGLASTQAIELSSDSQALHEHQDPPKDGTKKLSVIQTWLEYCHAPVFLASLSISLLYLTVLSTGVQYQTYMLSIGCSALSVSFIRVAAVCFELSATCFGPLLFRRIGQLRGGLWSINWQLIILTIGVGMFTYFGQHSMLASWSLTAAIVLSRFGLWGLDLAVQDLVQDRTPEHQRGIFSACESGMQNLFELLSFASTIIFPRAAQFQIPVYISLGAVLIAGCCYAAYVRRERGHLIHLSSCMKGSEYRHVEADDT